jgi:tetratricopeptide (TPR) repeat protein
MLEKKPSAESPRLRDPLKKDGAQNHTLVVTHVMQPMTREDLEKKTAAEPQNISAWLHLGYRCKQEKKFRQAVESFKQARRLDPASPKPDLFLGTVFKAMGHVDKAIHYCRKALALDPNLPEAYYNLACYFSLKENAPASLEHLERCYRLGFRDFEWVYRDPDLAFMRGRTNWFALINKVSEFR